MKSILTQISSLLFTVASTCSFAQENYVQGYIVNLKSDTIHGQIDYRNWERNPNEISFRPSPEGVPVTYDPMQITAFHAGADHYVGGIVDAETSPTSVGSLIEDKALQLSTDTIFLHRIVNGTRPLFHYKTQSGKDLFYITKEEGGFDLLIYKRYLVENHKIAEIKKYLAQLNFYLRECPGIQSRLEQTDYSKGSLTRLLEFYYVRTGTMPGTVATKEKVKVRFGIMAGTSLTSASFHGPSLYHLTGAKFDRSIDPAGGVFLELVLPRNLGKWSISNELLYSSYEVYGESHTSPAVGSAETQTTVGLSYIKLNNMVRYRHPLGGFSLLVNIGVSNGFAVGEQNITRSKNILGQEREEKALDDVRKYEQGYFGGVGTTFGNITIEMRYERGNGMSEYAALSTVIKRYFLLIGYRF